MKKILMIACLTIGTIASANRESGGRPGASAVYLYYRSFGTGIDYATKNYVTELIGRAGMNNKIIDQTSQIVGREGETLECVQFIDATNRHYFIKSFAANILNDARRFNGIQRTVVYVGFDCKNFKAATEQNLSAYLR